MPEFYGSQRLFWYLIVATTLNGASLVVLTYFLWGRARSGGLVYGSCFAFTSLARRPDASATNFGPAMKHHYRRALGSFQRASA
jgi:hypothetical protein